MVVFGAVALVGCVSAPTLMPRPAFPEAEYAALPKVGTGKVTGQAFLRTRGGDVKYGAGSEVFLNPVTSYSNFWYEQQMQLGQPLSAPDPRLNEYVRTQQADGMGNFSFENVPPGDYYVSTKVTWEVPAGYYSSSIQGGWIAEKIKVTNDQATKVMLTR